MQSDEQEIQELKRLIPDYEKKGMPHTKYFCEIRLHFLMYGKYPDDETKKEKQLKLF